MGIPLPADLLMVTNSVYYFAADILKCFLSPVSMLLTVVSVRM